MKRKCNVMTLVNTYRLPYYHHQVEAHRQEQKQRHLNQIQEIFKAFPNFYEEHFSKAD